MICLLCRGLVSWKYLQFNTAMMLGENRARWNQVVCSSGPTTEQRVRALAIFLRKFWCAWSVACRDLALTLPVWTRLSPQAFGLLLDRWLQPCYAAAAWNGVPSQVF
jgi:hypothetical protein